MLPIVLTSDLPAGLAGAGEGLARRAELLKSAGVTAVRFDHAVPTDAEIAPLKVLFIAGLDDAAARALAARTRRLGVLVNVEDVPELCDFHVPALVRRGDLVLTVSTGGRSPGLSRLVREDLERHFGPEWDERLDEIAALRGEWRACGLSPSEISQRTRDVVAERGWLE
jgi:precorrin-2 dehydrogenase/sirohydrochlorin ferrochelatase